MAHSQEKVFNTILVIQTVQARKNEVSSSVVVSSASPSP
jgi:hypothetical protein